MPCLRETPTRGTGLLVRAFVFAITQESFLGLILYPVQLMEILIRRGMSCLIALWLYAGLAFGRSANDPKAATGSARPGDSEVIQKIEDDWLNAERHTDPAAVEKILADDFVNLAPNGLAPARHSCSRTGRLTPVRLLPIRSTFPMCTFIFSATQPSQPFPRPTLPKRVATSLTKIRPTSSRKIRESGN